MQHGPFENCDAACVKIIINSRLMAPIADLLAETAGEGHPLFRRARILAAASRAACEAYDVAIEEGTLVRTGESPSGWRGCEDASFLMQLVGTDAQALNSMGLGTILDRFDALTDRANKITANLVRMRE